MAARPVARVAGPAEGADPAGAMGPEVRAGAACRCPGNERLYLPFSKRQEYLQSSGEKVLASFPVQATIHFYKDESESGSDEEELGEEVQPLGVQCQGLEGPGKMALGWGSGRTPGLSPLGGTGDLYTRRPSWQPSRGGAGDGE